MQTKNTHQVLSERGILLPNGAISQGKINLISGAITVPLLETLFIFAGKEASAMDRVFDLLNDLYNEGRETEMLAILHILYDVTGLQFSEDVELLTDHSEARHYFLFSLLLDMDDVLQSLKLDGAQI
ncbi:MAG: hypothetical protein VB099_15580 [Candidatus Limiplasma sp.]|nr:hypothetical protein [Candidatus Limiplasma sp.]